MMSSQPIQASSLYAESKNRLCERIANNIQSSGSVFRQIVKGSKSSDVIKLILIYIYYVLLTFQYDLISRF